MNKRTFQPFLVGIAGGTAGGKTTFCEKVQALNKEDEVVVLSLDSYYRNQDAVSMIERARCNYDHPDAFEIDLLLAHVRYLKAAPSRDQSIPCPCYDFSRHTRSPEKATVQAAPLILLEGILTLHWPELRSLCDLKIFVDAADELRLKRRLERDIRERGRTRESVLRQWQDTVHPAYLEFCAPTRQFADRVIDGSGDWEKDFGWLLTQFTNAG